MIPLPYANDPLYEIMTHGFFETIDINGERGWYVVGILGEHVEECEA